MSANITYFVGFRDCCHQVRTFTTAAERDAWEDQGGHDWVNDIHDHVGEEQDCD